MKDTYHFAFPAILGLTAIMFADVAVAESTEASMKLLTVSSSPAFLR
jgi:hypothetical protein